MQGYGFGLRLQGAQATQSILVWCHTTYMQHGSHTALPAKSPRSLLDHGRSPFTVSDVTDAVRMIVAEAGEADWLSFSGRSLLVGGATELHAAGVDRRALHPARRALG